MNTMSKMSATRILVIDDESLLREEIATILSEEGYACDMAENGRNGLQKATEFMPDIVLCDLAMPDIDGLTVMEKLRRELPETQVVIITAFGSMESAIEAFRKGACDYLLKPVNLDEMLAKIERIEERQALLHEVHNLRRVVSTREGEPRLVGDSPQIKQTAALIEQLATVDSSVLLLGETGTGKEVVARLLHERSRRRDKPFITVNCSAMPESLMESELFGHTRGAFTGAVDDRPGLFAAAAGGTLLLDEFCEMPYALQAKLLRVLERKEVQPVGSTEPITVDVRLVAATNRDPAAYVEQGKLREDLYYRIRVMEICLPPLRERKEDIPVLAQHFVDLFNVEMKRTVQGISNAALQALMLYSWPGNVRELKNTVERAMIFTTSGFLGLEPLPAEVLRTVPQQERVPDELKAALRRYESAHILAVLQKTDGNRAKAAQLLGVDRSTLHRKLSGSNEDD